MRHAARMRNARAGSAVAVLNAHSPAIAAPATDRRNLSGRKAGWNSGAGMSRLIDAAAADAGSEAPGTCNGGAGAGSDRNVAAILFGLSGSAFRIGAAVMPAGLGSPAAAGRGSSVSMFVPAPHAAGVPALREGAVRTGTNPWPESW